MLYKSAGSFSSVSPALNGTYVNEIGIAFPYLSIFILRDEILAWSKGCRPMDEVQINIVQFKTLQGLIQGWLNILWFVLVVPQFGCDE